MDFWLEMRPRVGKKKDNVKGKINVRVILSERPVRSMSAYIYSQEPTHTSTHPHIHTSTHPHTQPGIRSHALSASVRKVRLLSSKYSHKHLRLFTQGSCTTPVVYTTQMLNRKHDHLNSYPHETLRANLNMFSISIMTHTYRE